MNTKTSKAIQELRGIIGLTQGEFAVMIGASKDTVASWEVGRNKLSSSFARRIALATGVIEDDLLRGRSPLTTRGFAARRTPFTAETFKSHRTSYWGSSDETAARRHLKHCTDALELLFLAAARAGGDKGPSRLPAVADSFIHWCEQTREDFALEAGIDEQLAQRTSEVAVQKSYREWRRQQREDPTACRAMGFTDDPTKDDNESLRLTTMTMPLWRPGYPMRAPNPGKA